MIALIIALAVTVALGLVSRLCPVGWYPYDKSLGVALYAAAAYLALALLLFRRSSQWVAALALALCLAVEFFQVTGIPARHADWAAVRWLLGTDFSWHDVGCYFVGVAIAWPLDAWLLRRRVAQDHSNKKP